MKAEIFDSLPLPLLALPLPPLDDVNFALNFLILKFFGKNFFLIIQAKTTLLSLSEKQHIEPNYVTIFRGLSSQRSAHGRSQKFGFEVVPKQKVKSHGRKIMSNYFGSRDGFPSTWKLAYFS